MATMRVISMMAAAETAQDAKGQKWAWEEVEELSLYRRTTEGVVRRYFQASVELGRLPAPLGRGLGFLRAKSSYYKLSSFEDTMVFVCDVERCIKRLDPFEQELLQRMAMQAYTLEETAKLMRCVERTVERRYQEGMDKLTAMFLGNGMLKSRES